jgi:hypothetical protein
MVFAATAMARGLGRELEIEESWAPLIYGFSHDCIAAT